MAAKKSKTTTKSGRVVTVDFAKAGEGGSKRFKEGDYEVEFTGHKYGRSKDKDTPYVQVALKFVDGKYKGQTWDGNRTRLYLTDSSLWRLRNFLEAMGVAVPSKKVKLNLSKYHGKHLGVTVADGEPYNGRIASEIADFLDLDTLAGSDDEDEDEDEDDEDEDEDEDEDDDEDEDEIDLEDDDEI